MRKTIATIVAAAFLGGSAVTLTPVPAAAFVQIFFIPALMAKEDKNFKAVNPYAKKVAKKAKRSRR